MKNCGYNCSYKYVERKDYFYPANWQDFWQDWHVLGISLPDTQGCVTERVDGKRCLNPDPDRAVAKTEFEGDRDAVGGDDVRDCAARGGRDYFA